MSNIFVATCSSQNNLPDGVINCSLGEDGNYSYKDTCSFTCNTGYELTGSDNRTCQSDGSWSGTDSICRKSIETLHCQCCCSNIFLI